MITLVYNLCVKIEDIGVYVGSFITLAIDVIASLILLVKAIKAKNVSLKDALAGIIKIFSKKKKEDADEIAEEIVDDIKHDDEEAENDNKEDADNGEQTGS